MERTLQTCAYNLKLSTAMTNLVRYTVDLQDGQAHVYNVMRRIMTNDDLKPFTDVFTHKDSGYHVIFGDREVFANVAIMEHDKIVHRALFMTRSLAVRFIDNLISKMRTCIIPSKDLQ